MGTNKHTLQLRESPRKHRYGRPLVRGNGIIFNSKILHRLLLFAEHGMCSRARLVDLHLWAQSFQVGARGNGQRIGWNSMAASSNLDTRA